MHRINAHTKIATILKQHPAALEAIVSISPKFHKLRNPLLRKLMASRTSIGMASKIGGCSVNDFFEKLQPLGFIIDQHQVVAEKENIHPIPDFMQHLADRKVVEMDVRTLLDEGKDPFHLIVEKINQLQPQQILKLVNGFEPFPLIQLLEKRGYETYTEMMGESLVFTYFFKTKRVKPSQPNIKNTNTDWEAIITKFENNIKSVDVRHLEMPLPMLTILDELDQLLDGHALFVYHKRIPIFLIPELQERKFEYRIQEISVEEVHLLIFKS